MKALGIEFGSTRIKAVLSDEGGKVLASGAFAWENRLLPGGVWSYRLKATRKTLDSLDAIGVSGMMHGYLPFDARGKQLAPFRTWRCTITAEASEKLTKAFDFTIPQRWSVAHLYQRVLDGGAELKNLAFLTTLAGWIHVKLTGEKVLGLGEASGMFPVDPATKGYDARMARTFDRLAAKKGKRGSSTRPATSRPARVRRRRRATCRPAWPPRTRCAPGPRTSPLARARLPSSPSRSPSRRDIPKSTCACRPPARRWR